MYQFIIFIVLLSIFIYVSKNNYKKRSRIILNNLLEFKNEIFEFYCSLTSSEENIFINSLSPKEFSFFQKVKDNSLMFNSNINNLQSNMFIMENIMEKLKNVQKNKGYH